MIHLGEKQVFSLRPDNYSAMNHLDKKQVFSLRPDNSAMIHLGEKQVFSLRPDKLLCYDSSDFFNLISFYKQRKTWMDIGVVTGTIHEQKVPL